MYFRHTLATLAQITRIFRATSRSSRRLLDRHSFNKAFNQLSLVQKCALGSITTIRTATKLSDSSITISSRSRRQAAITHQTLWSGNNYSKICRWCRRALRVTWCGPRWSICQCTRSLPRPSSLVLERASKVIHGTYQTTCGPCQPCLSVKTQRCLTRRLAPPTLPLPRLTAFSRT